MTETDLQAIVKSMKSSPVLVVGDIMLDKFIYGSVDRISPESPVPVLNVSRETMMLGGAGNTLANLAGLGAKAYIISVVGKDEEGKQIKTLVKDMGLDTKGLLEEKNQPTIVKTRFLAGHQQLLRTDFEQKSAVLSAAAEKEILAKAKALISKVKTVVLSDYGKGLLSDVVISGIIAAAKSAGVPVIVDPKGRDFSKYRGASAVTPNKKELAEATGMSVEGDEAVIAAAEHIIDSCGIDAVIATRSAEGMSVIGSDAEPFHVRGQDIEVFDVSGAGDTVIATVAAALACGATINDAASLANMAGSIAVTKVGTAPIRADELLAAISGEGLKTGAQAAICDPAEARETVARWRAKGLKIGLTNGCFDILHFGHVSYLAAARQKCDRLIVGLNRDASVRILKGAERPVHDEASRAAVLAALSAVDLVVLFGAEKQGEDNTATALVESLQPDFYFKGGDYKLDEIPEAPAVNAQGGKVVIISAEDGHSTTNSLKKKNAA